MLEIRDLHVQFHTSDHEAVRGISSVNTTDLGIL